MTYQAHPRERHTFSTNPTYDARLTVFLTMPRVGWGTISRRHCREPNFSKTHDARQQQGRRTTQDCVTSQNCRTMPRLTTYNSSKLMIVYTLCSGEPEPAGQDKMGADTSKMQNRKFKVYAHVQKI